MHACRAHMHTATRAPLHHMHARTTLANMCKHTFAIQRTLHHNANITRMRALVHARAHAIHADMHADTHTIIQTYAIRVLHACVHACTYTNLRTTHRTTSHHITAPRDIHKYLHDVRARMHAIHACKYARMHKSMHHMHTCTHTSITQQTYTTCVNACMHRRTHDHVHTIKARMHTYTCTRINARIA